MSRITSRICCKMEVVSLVENDDHLVKQEENNNYIRMKKFKFVMMLFIVIFLTAGITLVALSFGDEKVVKMGRMEFNKLFTAYDELVGKYMDDLDKEALIDGAINGMVDAIGDPYTDYMTSEENAKFQESVTSSFEGIGAEVQELDGYVTVVSPIKGSPAEKAGVRPNDRIVTVDGENIQGMSATEAVLLIRGEKGTQVTLGIQRQGQQELIEITITRDQIPINTVYAEMLENNIAKIQITNFSSHTLQDLSTAISDMEEQGMKSLIIDVRRNPGGFLDQALMISNLFVPEGKNLYQIEYRDGTVIPEKARGGKKIDVPTVVLIDGGSASASEILAAAVSESANIPLVGEKSFGKGTVQTQKDFDDESNLKYTMAKWLTPEGNWIHEKGITPDYEVSLPEYASLPYINPDLELKESVMSKDVEAIEQMLEVLGFNPGKVDPFFDEETAKAVIEFQKSEELEETGIVTGETTIRLMRNLSDYLLENDPQVQKAIEVLIQQ